MHWLEWSPDGNNIAYEMAVRDETGRRAGEELWVAAADGVWIANADGTGSRRVKDDPCDSWYWN